MLLSTVSASLNAERKRARSRAWWTAASVALCAAWSSLMFLVLTVARPRTAFSVDYVAIAAVWCVGMRLIGLKVKPKQVGERAMTMTPGDVL